jgi:regulatory protein
MPETDLKNRAMRLLARREHSRVELGRKLAAHAEDSAEVEAVLDELQNRGWLSDERFTEQMVQVRRGKFGSARIVHELREKGVGDALIASTLSGLKVGELDAARAVWAKKFGELPVDAKERAKQIRFLMSRGFRQETISKVLRGRVNEDD